MNQDSNNFTKNSNKQNIDNSNHENSPINTDKSVANNISSNNPEPTNKSIFKKICIVLSIIIAIAGISLGIISITASFKANNGNYFELLVIFLLLTGGLTSIFYAAIAIGVIWIIYGSVKLINKFYTKSNTDNKKAFKRPLIIVIALLLMIFISIMIYNYYNKNLLKVLNNPPSYAYYNNTTYYFIYKDKIYYYKLEHNNSNDKIYDRLFVMNLDGTNKKKIAETDELRYASFYFVYNDYAYYYSIYHNENKRINLKTGEITSLKTKDTYLAKTLNNGIIYSIDNARIEDDNYTIFKKNDIKNNKIISETKTKYSIISNNYFLDYDGCNIYYLEDYYSKYPSIYKNNEIIYEFSEYDRYTLPEITFIAVNNNYIYYKQNDTIYKLNINNQSIEKELDLELKDIKRISSGNNKENFYYSNKNIYYFDTNQDIFKLVISNIEKQPEYIYSTNDKLIFTENTDNIKYLNEKDNLGSVLIYNKLNNSTEKMDNIRKVSFDEEYMYILYQSNNKYSVKKIKLN